MEGFITVSKEFGPELPEAKFHLLFVAIYL